MDLVHLIFVSSMVNEYGHDLPDVLQSALRNNERDGVNAMFLCKHGNMMGLLQGPSTSVQAAYQRMAADSRHFDVHRLYFESAHDTELSGTNVGCSALELSQVKDSSIGQFMFKLNRTNVEKRLRPGICRDLLVQFVETI
jgi:hypothetical protein